MKLLLTSNGLTTDAIKKKFLELAGKDPEDLNFVFIPTAAWPEEDQSWAELNRAPIIASLEPHTLSAGGESEGRLKLPTLMFNKGAKLLVNLRKPRTFSPRKFIRELGIKINELDLKDKRLEDITEVLNSADVIWVNGGNTFYLLYWVKKSGFDKEIKKLVKDGKLYVGLSAGSIIASPSIEVASWKGLDDPNVADLEDLDALNLIDFHIFVHYRKEWEETIKENESKLNGKLIRLTDAQAMVVEGKNYKII